MSFFLSQDAGLAATLSGKVSFEGTPPEVKTVQFGAEKQCAMMHAQKLPVVEDLVVNSNRTVKWALVYVKEGVSGTYPVPAESALVDQMGCVFIPHASAVRAGQKIVFKNSDPVLHNVRAASKINKAFNIAQPIQNMSTTKSFEKQETGIQLRCDVHIWMSAYLHAFEHPFYAVTADDGAYVIKDLPAGTYTVELWHEKLGTQTQTVTVNDTETKTLDFSLKQA